MMRRDPYIACAFVVMALAVLLLVAFCATLAIVTVEMIA